MDAMTGYVGVPFGVMRRAVQLFIESDFVYPALLGFGIAAALVLSFISAWQYLAQRGGKKL